MTVQEIQTEIINLSWPKLEELSTWFEEYQARMWDKKIETDLAAGRLDALLADVDAEYEGIRVGF